MISLTEEWQHQNISHHHRHRHLRHGGRWSSLDELFAIWRTNRFCRLWRTFAGFSGLLISPNIIFPSLQSCLPPVRFSFSPSEVRSAQPTTMMDDGEIGRKTIKYITRSAVSLLTRRNSYNNHHLSIQRFSPCQEFASRKNLQWRENERTRRKEAIQLPTSINHRLSSPNRKIHFRVFRYIWCPS